MAPVLLVEAECNLRMLYRLDFRDWRADVYVVKSSDLTHLKQALSRCLAAAWRREQENMIEFTRGRFQ